jgi:hypothetical protein
LGASCLTTSYAVRERKKTPPHLIKLHPEFWGRAPNQHVLFVRG